jgi:AcrR family transcriptional regulator
MSTATTTMTTARRRRGRPAGDRSTRQAIVTAARAAFAELGYRGATIRGIAERAGTDPALIYHYFDDKRALFAATIDLPLDAEVIADAALTSAEPGRTLVAGVLTAWEQPELLAAFNALLRAGLSDAIATATFRERFADRMIAALAARLDGPDAELRAALVASQLAGLGLLRHLIAVEPLAGTDRGTIVEAVAPTVDRYLGDPLHGRE